MGNVIGLCNKIFKMESNKIINVSHLIKISNSILKILHFGYVVVTTKKCFTGTFYIVFFIILEIIFTPFLDITLIFKKELF